MHQTSLKRTELGRTGLQITRVGFGAWAIGGGDWEFGWGPQEDDESIAAIHHALERGINWIDTAAAYGFGRSEQIVGRALEGVAERPYVFTKCSLFEGPGRTVVHSLKRDSILREAEPACGGSGSTRSTSTRSTGRTRRGHRGGLGRARRAQGQGLVRHIGVSNFDADQLRGSGRSPRSRRCSRSTR
jgi:aryl-alcohol dehydrogenase-like predicted oxidoreductase